MRAIRCIPKWDTQRRIATEQYNGDRCYGYQGDAAGIKAILWIQRVVITITDLSPLLASTFDTAQEHPVVRALDQGFDAAILKFQEFSVNEVFGYALGRLADVPLPRAEAVWYSAQRPTGKRDKIQQGDIGILIEYHSDWETISRAQASRLDPGATGAALALCAFDRFEWGEFGISNEKVMFVDLERLLPSMGTRWLLGESDEERQSYLRKSGGYYARAADSFAAEALEEARELKVLPGFIRSMNRLRALSDAEIEAAFDIGPHPLNELLRPFAARHARIAIEAATRRIRDAALG